MLTWVLLWPVTASAGGEIQQARLTNWLGLVLAALVTGLVVWLLARRKQRAIESRAAHSLQQVKFLIEHADCILWEAQVELKGDSWKWRMKFHPTVLSRKFFGDRSTTEQVELWYKFQLPDSKEMDRRAREALEQNRPGYEQEFRAVRDGRTDWLHENVSITPIGPGIFWLVGLVTDITAQRTAEEAKRHSEIRLAQLLERTDSLIWQSQLTRTATGEMEWKMFIPPSPLYRRIFDKDPEPPVWFFWREIGVPEEQEMKLRWETALAEGASGYRQTFHVPKPDGDIWLGENVSIKVIGPAQWELVGIITDITARRDAEAARQASEGQLRELLTQADCLLWEGTAEKLGDDWKWNFKIQPSILYQKLYGSLQPPDNSSLWRGFEIPEWEEMGQRSGAAMTEGLPGYEQFFHIVRKDGSVIWIQENVTIKALGPNRYSLVGVATDISARRAAEVAVRDSERRYRVLFQHTPVAIVETDFTRVGRWLDGLRKSGVQSLADWFEADPARVQHGAGLVKITNINETALTLVQAKSPLSFRRRRHLLETPDALRAVRNTFVAIWEGCTSSEAELKMHDLQGGDRHLNMRWWIGRNESGIDLTQTVMVFIDLTDLKKTEAELATEKERLAVTLRAMTEGVITTDVAGRILFINPAAATLTEWDAGQAIGRLVAEICSFANTRDGAAVEVPVSRVAQGDIVVNLPPQTQLLTRNGTKVMVEGCCAPIHSAASAVIGAVLVFRDVTETERLEEELVRATRLESVGVLAGGIAHDFNNILTAVMGNLSLALLDVPADTPTGVSLRAAEKAATRACDLTQQLLTFSKGGEPIRTAVQLDAIVREMTTFALHGSQVKGIFDFAPQLWPADADKGQIGRVVQNLAINSVQAMPAGGTLRVSACNDRVRGLARPGLTPGDYLLLTISDTGEGIPPENLARIFDPYFTTKKTGSGLGLAAVYSIIKKHRGHIEVESQLGQGTTFRLWLPALHEKTEPAATRPPITSAVMNGRVLFMDDDDIIRAMATKLLRRFGLEVVCAGDGTEMVEKYREASTAGRPFSIVVMDLTVPGGMGGLPALAKLKEIDPLVKAIVSSGYSSDPVLANFREHGFCAVISKPYDIHEFSRVLRETLASPIP